MTRFSQPRHDRVTDVDEQPEAIVIHKIAAARLARPGQACNYREPQAARSDCIGETRLARVRRRGPGAR
jgi:hypothetical protein